jgi:Dullard-like phosphatase family protein
MNRSQSQMFGKNLKLKKSLGFKGNPYFNAQTRLPGSVKNSQFLKELHKTNNTPKKQIKIPSHSKPADSEIYLSRRFSTVINPSSPKRIKTIPYNLQSVKKKLVSVNQFITQCKPSSLNQLYQQSKDSLTLIKALGPVDQTELNSRKVKIPKKLQDEGKKTLIFDLDETLVHCCVNGEVADEYINIQLPNGLLCEAGINVRPFAKESLEMLSKDFEIFVFTASHPCYADVVCDFLDPQKRFIKARFCIQSGGIYVKDLRIFVNRKIKDIVIVDNTLHCVAYQIDNCIPIISWFSDKSDKELKKLMTFLDKVKGVDDVRVVNRKYFNLSDI